MIPLFFFTKTLVLETLKPYTPFISKIGEMILVMHLPTQIYFPDQLFSPNYLNKIQMELNKQHYMCHGIK